MQSRQVGQIVLQERKKFVDLSRKCLFGCIRVFLPETHSVRSATIMLNVYQNFRINL